MKYENAEDIIPKHLLKEIQKYAAGKLLYIPSGEYKRAWGESSGYRGLLQKRNQMIRNKYAHGMTVAELADEYYLSLDSIKKIIYSKQHSQYLSYAPTIESAVEYAYVGMIEEWVQCYMLFSVKHNIVETVTSETNQLCFGVIKFPLRLIEFEDSSCTQLNETSQTIDQTTLSNATPLVVHYEAGKFYAHVQYEHFIQLKLIKLNVYPSIIVMKDSSDYKRFMQLFGSVFMYVNK